MRVGVWPANSYIGNLTPEANRYSLPQFDSNAIEHVALSCRQATTSGKVLIRGVSFGQEFFPQSYLADPRSD